MCLKILFSCWLQDSKQYIKVSLQIADFTVPKYKMQYIRTGHSNTLAIFLKLIRTKYMWNQAGYGCFHPQDWLWRLQVAEHSCDSWWTIACYCYAAYIPRTLMKQSLSSCCLCKLGAARHACLPGSTYSSEGQVTVLDIILLGAIVQSFPMSTFSLDWNKIHSTGKVIVPLRKNQQPFCCALMTLYPTDVCVWFFSNMWQ